jgi:hypothetical protein
VRVAASTGAPPKAATVTCKSFKQSKSILKINNNVKSQI